MNYDEQNAAYVLQCEQALEAALDSILQPGSQVGEAARYSVMNGGKRVRGVLLLAVCDMLRGNAKAAQTFAAALEMVHAFSLIHDDMPCMDNDDMRRGKPACHIAYGQANALLAGDLLSITAFEVLAQADAAADIKVEAVRCLSAAAGGRGMVYGQELDMYYESHPASAAILEQIHRHKTGALIDAAVKLGVLASPKVADPAAERSILLYGKHIGLVFQIVDDVLDVTASPQLLGKPAGSDAAQGKTTFATLLGVEASRQKAQDLTSAANEALRRHWGGEANFLCLFSEKLLHRAY